MRSCAVRRFLLIVVFAMVVVNVSVLSLVPTIVETGVKGPDVGEDFTSDGEDGAGRACIPKGHTGGSRDGLGPPDEVYEDVEGPPPLEEKC